MANPLLIQVSPQELASRGEVIEYKGKIESFERLSEIVEADLAGAANESGSKSWRSCPVEVRLESGWADDRKVIPTLSGIISVQLPATCQRCLEPFELPIRTEVDMLLLTPGDKPLTSGDQEVWEVEDGTIRLQDVVEESLVMAMPFAAMHVSTEDCESLAQSIDDESEAAGADVVRPFADLRSQMEKMK